MGSSHPSVIRTGAYVLSSSKEQFVMEINLSSVITYPCFFLFLSYNALLLLFSCSQVNKSNTESYPILWDLINIQNSIDFLVTKSQSHPATELIFIIWGLNSTVDSARNGFKASMEHRQIPIERSDENSILTIRISVHLLNSYESLSFLWKFCILRSGSYWNSVRCDY